MSQQSDPSDDNLVANTNYILNLQYDLNALLAIDLTPKQIDLSETGESREHNSGQVIIVTKKLQTASSNLSENSLLNPGTGVVFPGALVKQDHTLAEGLPTPFYFPRGPLTLRVDLPGLIDKGVITIPAPTNINVEVEIQKVIDYWFDNVRDKHSYKPTIRAFAESHMAYTKEQIGIECGFGAQWSKSQVTAGLKSESTGEETVVYRIFKQVYYTVIVEEPEMAGAVFSNSVKLNEHNMLATQPPGYVRSVDYGRIIVVQMTTSENITKQEAEATLDYKSLGAKFDTKLKEHYENIAKNSSFKVLVMGGGNDSAQLLAGDIGKMTEVITNGIEFSRESPSYPISYTVADLKTRTISEMKTTTQYIETIRKVLPDRSITLHHTGGFVANFYVTWQEYDINQKKYIDKSWNSGDKTAPYEHMISFPGDAQNFTIEGRYAIFFKTWRSKFKKYTVMDSDKTITLKGITLYCDMTD